MLDLDLSNHTLGELVLRERIGLGGHGTGEHQRLPHNAATRRPAAGYWGVCVDPAQWSPATSGTGSAGTAAPVSYPAPDLRGVTAVR
jgi:hypothetical protein